MANSIQGADGPSSVGNELVQVPLLSPPHECDGCKSASILDHPPWCDPSYLGDAPWDDCSRGTFRSNLEGHFIDGACIRTNDNIVFHEASTGREHDPIPTGEPFHWDMSQCLVDLVDPGKCEGENFVITLDSAGMKDEPMPASEGHGDEVPCSARYEDFVLYEEADRWGSQESSYFGVAEDLTASFVMNKDSSAWW